VTATTAGVERAAMLAGVRVLDLTQFLSGPYGAQILADLGADVVKIEAPQGDSSRAIPPHFIAGDSAYFHAINRSKRSVQLDLRSDAGREVFLDLLRTADVVLDNFRPGVLERLRITHEDLVAVKPDLITCSITGFGNEGRYRDRPAYDAIVQAMAGGMSLTGHPGSAPARMGLPVGDIAAGMYAAIAISSALVRLAKTGKGDHLEIAMLDCQLAMLSYQAAYFLHDGEVPGPQGSGHVSIPTYRAFECSDGRHIMVTANTEAMWRELCAALGLEALVEDPRFVDASARLTHRLELWDQLEPAFLRFDAVDALEALVERRVPAALINTVADALEDPNTAERGMVMDLANGAGQSVSVAGNPIRSTAVATDCQASFPPGLGSDTETVLRELGYDAARLDGLRRGGVVGPFDKDAAIRARASGVPAAEQAAAGRATTVKGAIDEPTYE
jgi:crotonobetainyl-CoA:carnitine CoA-transferase CaiB-like acyl-CoA transferase